MVDLQSLVIQSRRDILRMVHAVNSGHPGGSLGCAELMVCLFHEIMNVKPNFDMDGNKEDIFFVSNGHISPLYYSVLARKGYFQISELATFRKLNSRLQGHPTTHEGLPGVRIASGSLGQGLSVAIGTALTKTLRGDEYLVYCLLGDGELQEGQNWEAIMFAASKNVDNLVCIIDINGQQIDGATDEVLDLGNIEDKFRAFGWDTVDIKNGNDIKHILEAFKEVKTKIKNRKPIAVMLHTKMGNGVDFMMGTHEWHGIAPNDEQLEEALKQNPETPLKDFFYNE